MSRRGAASDYREALARSDRLRALPFEPAVTDLAAARSLDQGALVVMLEGTLALLRRRFYHGRWTLLPLRLVIGFGFAAHGYAKLARGPESFAAIIAAMGIPAPGLVAWSTSLLELLGGGFLILGAAVVPLSLPLGAVMLTAMFGVHFRYGFSSIRLLGLSASGATFGPVGYELNLVYLAGLLTLALSGPGPLSIDQWLVTRRRNASTAASTANDSWRADMILNQVTLPTRDIARGAAFYRLLGFVQIVDAAPRYARFELPDGLATLSLELSTGQASDPRTVIYFECDELDATVEKLRARGVSFTQGPRDEPWLWREARLRDPDGNELCLYHAGENRRFPPWRLGRGPPLG